MRAKVTFVGIGKRVTGTSSKNNKVYDFTPVSILFQDPKWGEGLRAATVNIDSREFVLEAIQLEGQREVVMHQFNNNWTIDAFL